MRQNSSALGHLKQVKDACAAMVLRAPPEFVNAFVCLLWVDFRDVGITSVLRRYHVGAGVGIRLVWGVETTAR